MRASAALKSAKSVRIERFGADGGTCDDVVATEEPLEIRLSWTHPDGRREQKSISITMRTPGNDEELAAGFLLTEGIIAGPAELEAVGPCGPPAANGLINVVRVDLARDVEVDLARLERHFYTSSSCGVCGKASLEAVAVQGRYDLHDNTLRMSAEGLGALPDRLRALQSVFERTGGLHASGLFDAAGQVRVSREDVGRHNALDKLIGQALLKDELPLSDCGVVVSGRASFELMQKAMMAGIPMVAAVGAPSSLAVEFAEEFGMTLVGFLTANRFNVYSRPDRIA
ncbi:MAG: formate dehydrogenase accessory sulfurtransferase FdhD [Gammaproteobacteria bacterium]|nr:formate dehydrogenase accessory sulfurtransferase FdhD [Gammaproteobacteria bacterium]